MDILKVIELIAGGVGAAALFWAGFRGHLSSDTIKLMKENKQAQDDAIKRLEDTSGTQATQIAELNGQIKMLKDIPLSQIAKSLEVVSQSHVAMQEFIKNYQEHAVEMADEIAKKVINYLKDK